MKNGLLIRQLKHVHWRNGIPVSLPLAFTALFTVYSAFGVDHYVNVSNSSPLSPYTTWARAATNIQAAVDVASAGETIWVTNGTYELTSDIIVEKGIRVISVNGSEATIIDGNNTVRCWLIRHADAQVSGFTIKNGNGYAGGGAGFEQPGGLLSDCILVSNTATYGGGVYMDDIGHVRNCLIVHNHASSYGGGIFSWSTGIVENCTVVTNRSDNCGGGVMLYQPGGIIKNSIIYHNYAPNAPDHYLGTGEYIYSCMTPAPAGSIGIVTNPPLLCDMAAGDFQLKTNSPCINTGTNQDWMVSGEDLAGYPRINTERVDMGCYEKQRLYATFTPNPSEGFKPLSVTFHALPEGTNTLGIGYLWDFDGNGSVDTVSTTNTTEHLYTSYGIYTVSLTVTNTSGDRAENVKSNLVHVAPSTAYVAHGTGNIWPYASWATAATGIQQAVDAGVTGMVILVSNGVYTASLPVKLNRAVTLKGYANVGDTIINGNFSSQCVQITHSHAILENMTLSRGWPGSGVDGGGVYMSGGTLRDCIVTNCRALSADGGGIYLDGTGRVEKTLVTACYSTDFGGGIAAHEGGTVDACVLEYNQTDNGGGGIYMLNATLLNSLIRWNEADSIGGGIYMLNNSLVQNCTVVSNVVDSGGAGGIYGDGTFCDVQNSIVYDNQASTYENYRGGSYGIHFDYSCTTPLPSGNGNTSSLPCFVNANAGDYHLHTNSPCIDSGSATSAPSNDLDKVSRPLDGDNNGSSLYDMGCYEFAHANVDADEDGLSDAEEAYTYHCDPLKKDTDGDTQDDGGEVTLGTDPTNPNDYFSVDAVTKETSSEKLYIEWEGRTGALYTVRHAESITGSWNSVTGWVDRPGIIGIMRYTNEEFSGQGYYTVWGRKP